MATQAMAFTILNMSVLYPMLSRASMPLCCFFDRRKSLCSIDLRGLRPSPMRNPSLPNHHRGTNATGDV